MATRCYASHLGSPERWRWRWRETGRETPKNKRRRGKASLKLHISTSFPRTVCFAALSQQREPRFNENIDTFSKYSGYIADASATEAEFLTEYNASRIASIFSKRPFLLGRRLLHIASTLGVWALFRYLDTLSGRSESMFKKRAGELRAALIQLGPAFVKIAQAVSSRPDVISPAYLEELSLLQDRIAPFATDAALQMIEQELGLPVDLIFSEISPQPVAAASIGQVYQARLRANGQTVAVKVQRPGVRAAISLDIFILRLLAGFVRRAGKFNTDLEAIVDEWATSLFREMDYEAEAQNGLRFRDAFGTLPDVIVPEMFPQLSSQRVLVMEWVEGQRLSDVNDLHLIEVGVYCSLSQLLDNGFYHADPHPGNLMRTYDGKLAYLDFGMMGEMPQNLRDSLIEACVHLVNRDFDALAEDFVALGFLPAAAQKSDVSKALTEVFQNAVSKGARNISFGDLSGNLGRTMYQFKFQIPSYFSLVVRSLTVLEGIALSSNPDYKVLGSSYPWIARKVLTDDAPQLRSTLKALLYKDGAFQIDRLESLVTEALRSATIESLAVKEERPNTTRNPILKKILAFILSDDGGFVKETVLEEVAKGLDALARATIETSANSVVSSVPALGTLGQPNLLEENDLQNLNTLIRLRKIMFEGLGESSNVQEQLVENDLNVTEIVRSLDSFTDIQNLVNSLPTLAVIFELPVQAQWQALLLPGELVGKLTSRIIARTIRNSVNGVAQDVIAS